MKRGLLISSTVLLLASAGCSDDTSPEASDAGTSSETGDGDGDPATGDGDGDESGDGDGDESGDGDGDETGDGDGDETGDGDGDETGDGDGDETGDGDGDETGDGDGDATGDGDGDPGEDVCGDGMVTGDEACDDGVNDGSYGGCSEDCQSFGGFCGDGELDGGNELCDDGVNDGGYGGCTEDCQGFGPSCGDGLIDGDNETCDDANTSQGDGCSDVCQVEGGACCDGEPSLCIPIDEALVDEAGGLGIDIPDNAYDGTLDSMGCAQLELQAPMGVCGPVGVADVFIGVGFDHTWIGDLVIKLEAPDGTVVPLMSRPGVDEPEDNNQNEGGLGDSSNASSEFLMSFGDEGEVDAELMGAGIGDDAFVCGDDDQCDYAPNSGAAEGEAFEDLLGREPVGSWRLCFGDGENGDAGALEYVFMEVSLGPPAQEPDPDPDPDPDLPPELPLP